MKVDKGQTMIHKTQHR